MSEYYAVERTGDHLKHYGIKGMRWGVRKAVLLGNEKKLDRHFKKAAKKLSKLQDQALHSGKYAAKATAYGTAAVGTGTLAIGNNAFSKSLQKRFMSHRNLYTEGTKMLKNAAKYQTSNPEAYKRLTDAAKKVGRSDEVISGSTLKGLGDLMEKHSTKIRAGAGIASLGLGALAAKNAYIAANKRKYLNKADGFRKAMDETFAGTKYQGQYIVQPKQKKKRR